MLRIIDGLSEAETAAVMGCSAGTAKSNPARGLDKVRAALKSTPSTAQEAAR
ncbi:sigma factor-like helix-turn-helix DNA-binding protein [Micromonospora sp. NPDC006766]|uniref:sigma factor-like helix-turn-helix DNA-binding protein n=1 Tax=Micromonospora sp. NPDC006766 TaxID=3154778 RepID=UPI0033C250F6